MNALDTLSDPLEAIAERPLYVDTRPFILAIVLFIIYTVVQEMPAAQRYMNMRSMARDRKPTR